MSYAILPGSYDPITVGHLDIIRRASLLFDNVTVLVAKNNAKHYLLTAAERLELVSDAIKNLKNVTAEEFDGMLVDYIESHERPVIVKGIRGDKDLYYEQNMAHYNRQLSRRKYGFTAETLFLISEVEYSEISSTLVRTLIDCQTDFSDLVPNAALLTSMLEHSAQKE